MRIGHNSLCPIIAYFHAVFGVTCFTQNQVKRPGGYSLMLRGPSVRVLTIYQPGKKENTGTGDQTDVHCHEPVSREKRFRGRV